MESVPTMKKFCLFALLFSCIGTVGTSQTIDVSTLSDYEKQHHRIGFCIEIGYKDGGNDTLEIFSIVNLMSDNGFRKPGKGKAGYQVERKSANDTKTKLILEEIVTTQQMLDECNEDLKAILKDEYIPNFSYMEK
jgi:hypothetical protein